MLRKTSPPLSSFSSLFLNVASRVYFLSPVLVHGVGVAVGFGAPSGVRPADRNPVRLRLHLPQSPSQFAECRRQVVVHDRQVEEMTVLVLHQPGGADHLLEVFILSDKRERKRDGTLWPEKGRDLHKNLISFLC